MTILTAKLNSDNIVSISANDKHHLNLGYTNYRLGIDCRRELLAIKDVHLKHFMICVYTFKAYNHLTASFQ